MQFKKNSRIIFLVFVVIFFFVSAVSAANLGDWGDFLKKSAGTDGIYNVDYGKDIPNATPALIIARYVGVMLTIAPFLGYVLFVRMIWAGYQWMTARGNEEQVESAKKTIRHATIGVVIMVALYVISFFVVESMKNISGYEG